MGQFSVENPWRPGQFSVEITAMMPGRQQDVEEASYPCPIGRLPQTFYIGPSRA
jgi:hypothetical protein